MYSVEVYTPVFNPLNPQPDGTVTMNYPGGADTVASLQKDGTFSTRPKDTAGRWERAKIVPGGLLFKNDEAKITRFVPYVS